MASAISSMWSVAGVRCSGRSRRRRGAVFEEGLGVDRRCTLRAICVSATALRMILSSTSVMFMTWSSLESAGAQPPAQNVDEGERPEIADVRVVVDGGAASVHADGIVAGGCEVLHLLGQRVVEAQRHRKMSGDSHRSRGSARAQPNRPSRKQDCVPAAVQPLQARSHGWLRHADLCSPTPPHLRRVAPAHLPDVAHPEPAGAHASSTHPRHKPGPPGGASSPMRLPHQRSKRGATETRRVVVRTPPRRNRGPLGARKLAQASRVHTRATRLAQEPARLPTRTASTRAQPGLPGGRELVHASSPQPGRKRDATETRKVVVRASPTRGATLSYQELQACRCELRPRAVERRPSRSAQTRPCEFRPARRKCGLSGARNLAHANSARARRKRGPPGACKLAVRV